MAAEETAEAQPKGSRTKLFVIVAAVLALEAALIIGVFVLIAGPPTVSASQVPEDDVVSEDDRIVETQILDARLPNNRTGVTYLYDTEIYVQTRQRHVEQVERELDQFQNEIRAEIAAIWRTADPHHFQEPRLESLTRKVSALLDRRFGSDEETSEPIVNKAVIVMGTGFRIDS